ncbi:ATP-binding protein [Lentzea sp. PSKA42]|uniref:ATP-binding protein n=1 Tax=Lentzea indica TaxID=2604800 RepID=A0ABX1F9B7_9PSEU|nr:ATP-binding protein [Lentzea indica]NKE55399.1 ATP-binding protein [Lentzea indica]
MSELIWREVIPPKGLTLAAVTSLVRALAGRPHFGLAGLQPVVLFELWLSKESARWLVGYDEQLGRHFAGDLAAQVPNLALVTMQDSPRKLPTTAREVRPTNMAYPLRLDTAASVTTGLLGLRQRLGQEESVVLQWIVGPSHARSMPPARLTLLQALGLKPAPKAASGDQAAWRTKIAEPLFGIRGRVGAAASTTHRATQLIGPAVSALALASGPNNRVVDSWQSKNIARRLFMPARRPRSWNGMVNAAELAVLVGLPVDGVQLHGQESALAPPPRSLLLSDQDTELTTERVVGTSTHPRTADRAVRVPAKSLASHIHLIAPTGAGKSTTLARWVLQDIKAGRSIFLVEPKDDLVTDVLARMPKELWPQVRLVEPGASGPVIGFNPLAGPVADAERRADSLLGLFRELFGTALGPRSSDILLHTLIMAARLEDGTLTDIPAILTNDGFRRQVLAKVSDPLTIAPWAAWFDSLSELERSRVAMPILNKTRAWTARGPLRHLLGQAAPALRLDDLFKDEQLIVLVSLNTGSVGPETAKLLGALLLRQLREAIQRQSMVPRDSRRPVSVIVDEWQNFVDGMDFGDMLATARALESGFTLVHQLLPQLTPRLRADVLANARSRMIYRPAEADAKELARVLGGDTTAEELLRLPAFHAAAQVLVDGATSRPFIVSTSPLSEPTEDPSAARQAIRQQFGVAPEEIDARLIQRWQDGGGSNPDGGVGFVRRRTS